MHSQAHCDRTARAKTSCSARDRDSSYQFDRDHKRDRGTAVLQSSIQPEPKRGDIVRETDVKEGAGRQKQGIHWQDKDMLATIVTPISSPCAAFSCLTCEPLKKGA